MRLAINHELETAGNPAHGRLLQVFLNFLELLSRQLNFLTGKTSYQGVDEDIQIMIWLSSSSFRKIGTELISILNFIEKQCSELEQALGHVASDTRKINMRSDVWARIALYVNGQILGFAGVEPGIARTALGWPEDALNSVRSTLHDFKIFIERQAHRDIFVGGNPQENIARALLQARLASLRTYREVPTRGGRSDILAFVSSGKRVVIETKIWRGKDNYEVGLKELSEYIEGEGDDGKLLGAFYVVFDPTDGVRAAKYQGGAIAVRKCGKVEVEIVIISLKPVTPSKSDR